MLLVLQPAYRRFMLVSSYYMLSLYSGVCRDVSRSMILVPLATNTRWVLWVPGMHFGHICICISDRSCPAQRHVGAYSNDTRILFVYSESAFAPERRHEKPGARLFGHRQIPRTARNLFLVQNKNKTIAMLPGHNANGEKTPNHASCILILEPGGWRAVQLYLWKTHSIYIVMLVLHVQCSCFGMIWANGCCVVFGKVHSTKHNLYTTSIWLTGGI